MKNIYLKKNVFVLLLVVLASCENVQIDDYEVYEIDLSTGLKSRDIDEIAESVKFIPLETNASFLITNIINIEEDDGIFFIQDDRRKNIYLFNNKGKHILNLVVNGKGPGELQTARYYFVDKGNNLVIVGDPYSRKLIKYSYKGEIILERSNISNSGFGVFGNGIIADVKSKNFSRITDLKEDDIYFIRYDMDDDSITKIKSSDSFIYNKGVYFNPFKKFYMENNKLNMFDVQGGMVHIYDEENLTFRTNYKISFINNDFGLNGLRKFDKSKNGDYLEYLKRNDLALITALYENRKHIYIRFNFKGQVNYGIINKNTKELNVFNQIASENMSYPAKPYFCGTDNNDNFFGLVNPVDIVFMKKKFGKEYVEVLKKYNLDEIEENDNPIIAVIKLR